MDVAWTLTEVARIDREHTALYVLRNPGELHTATIEARPEYDSVTAMSDDDDDAGQLGWIRYFVTWSRSGAFYADQITSLSLLQLVMIISDWEIRTSHESAFAEQLAEFWRTKERLHFAAIENARWGMPVTESRLRLASDAYETQSRHMNEEIDRFLGRRNSDAPAADFEFVPDSAEAVMRARLLLS